MVFCVVTDGAAETAANIPECDVALFGFSGLGEVDYESELKGKTEKFENAARLSKAADCCAAVKRSVGGCCASRWRLRIRASFWVYPI